ncbi:MAG: D-alanyl-D-alanine carboxypeptidase/D-alanyl-D-alanine-endopeptidase [Myxococcota bacterium]
MTIPRSRSALARLILLSLTLAVGCTSVPPRQTSSQVTSLKLLRQHIDKLVEETDPHAHVGIHVMSLPSGKPVYSRNAARLFTPASTLKVITAAAALHYLGPSHRFVTKLLTDAKRPRRGRLNMLYLVGGGDPTLGHGDLADLADRLKQLGVRTIRGDIVVDDSLFDNVLWGKGWMWDDRPLAYSAPIEAASCDSNRLLVRLTPGDRVGDPAHVLMSYNTTFVKVKNRVTTVKPNRSISLSINVLNPKQPQQRDGKQGLQYGETIDLQGSVPLGSAGRTLKFAVGQPSLFAGTVLKEQLKLLGITVKGRVRRGEVPTQGTKKLTAHRSASLRELLVELLRTSDDHATESLIKIIGVHVREAPGSFAAGKQAVLEFMRQHTGVSTRTLLLADGSGLSRYSLVSPRQMTSVLRFTWNNFALRPDFIGSLPRLATYSNHLAKGLDPHSIVRHARVKTGTLTGVRNLAGYLVTTHGDPLAFTIFINGFVGSGAPYRQLQQRILRALADLPKQE